MKKLNNNVDIQAVIELLMLTGQLLLENGAETYRVETAVVNMFRALDSSGKVNVVALFTLLTIDVFDGEHHTAIRRIRRRGINLDKFARVNDISRKVSEGKMGMEQAFHILNELKEDKSRNRTVQILGAGIGSGAFLFMIGGGIFESIIAFSCSVIIQAGWLLVKRTASLVFVANISSGLLTAVVAVIGALLLDCDAERIIFATLLPLFPGVAMIIAIRDIINGDLTSGVARGAESVLTAVGLALGTSFGVMCASFAWEFTLNHNVTTMMDLPYAIFGLLVSFGTGLMLNSRFKPAISGAVIGGIVYAVFLLCSGISLGLFAATLTLTALSEVSARIMKVPSTLFLIIGVHPLVPGAGVYKAALLILQNNTTEASVASSATAAEFFFLVAGIAIISVFAKRCLSD